MSEKSDKATFTGFGFGAIQSGLFVYEAFRTGCFGRIVIAEVMPEIVSAVRANGGSFAVNIAGSDEVRPVVIDGVEIYNPRDPADRRKLVEAVSESSEIATALPSVSFYGDGSAPDHVTGILRDGLAERVNTEKPPAVVYTAENNNHAAEVLTECLRKSGMPDPAAGAAILNTVIGKMSGVIDDSAQIERQQLHTVTPDMQKAFLVEEFNRILISRIPPGGGQRHIEVFEEKDDLLPFEEAKLFGHNATHALIGYMLAERGIVFMDMVRDFPEILAMAREAFINESGSALCRKYSGLDALFTPDGFAAYADDLLERMMNPHLCDRVERVVRDPRRKLGWNDRLIGTLRLAMSQGIDPRRFAEGAAAALRLLAKQENRAAESLLNELWPEAEEAERAVIGRMVGGGSV